MVISFSGCREGFWSVSLFCCGSKFHLATCQKCVGIVHIVVARTLLLKGQLCYSEPCH